MAQDKELGTKEIKWTVSIAGMMLAIITGVFMVGWNARGQTAQIQAVELKTDNLKLDYDEHCITQMVDTKAVNKTLKKLEINEAAQTVILNIINEKMK